MAKDPAAAAIVTIVAAAFVAALVVAGVALLLPIVLVSAAGYGVIKLVKYYATKPAALPHVVSVDLPSDEELNSLTIRNLARICGLRKLGVPPEKIYHFFCDLALNLFSIERTRQIKDTKATLDAFNISISGAFDEIIQILPPAFFTGPEIEYKERENATRIVLLDLIPNVGITLEEVLAWFYIHEKKDPDLFLLLRKKIDANFDRVSLDYGKLVRPSQHEGSSRELVTAYLASTPLADLFDVPIVFSIPEHPYRFEHTFCLGPSGSGKTTLLQQIVLDDLAKVDPPAMVIIDPKGLMVERLQRLDVFNPETGRLKDRLVIVDPTQDPPPALNMFHPADKWNRMYADNVRRQIENQTISTYAYIFSSLESALTQKQTVAFTFAVRLLFAMQTANIHTLIDFLDDPAKTLAQSRFRVHIERLDETSRRFFQNDYYSTSFGETRQQIKARLYSILQRPEFVAMFSTPERKLDMFDCLQKRKIVLVNTAMSILGSEGSQLFGRYMIALTLNAAFERISLKDKTLWNPAFLIIDEFQLFADEIKTPELLRLAREYNLGVTIAVQDMHGRPFNDSLRNAISTNTSIKYAASPEGVDINYAARDLRCDPEFLRNQTKTATHARFACYVRGLTERAVSISVPFGNIDDQPQMTQAAHDRLVELNRERLTVSPAEPVPVPQPASPEPVPASAAIPPQPVPATPTPAVVPLPPANDPDAGAHTDAAAKW